MRSASRNRLIPLPPFPRFICFDLFGALRIAIPLSVPFQSTRILTRRRLDDGIALLNFPLLFTLTNLPTLRTFKESRLKTLSRLFHFCAFLKRTCKIYMLGVLREIFPRVHDDWRVEYKISTQMEEREDRIDPLHGSWSLWIGDDNVEATSRDLINSVSLSRWKNALENACLDSL